MKFTCLKNNLEWAVATAERFTGKNMTLPILGNLLLEVDGNNLFISATNLEYAIKITVPGRETKDGRVSVPAKIINSLTQSIRGEKISLEGRQNNLFLETDSIKTRINGVPADDFPLLPKIKATYSVNLETTALKRGLEKVLPSVSLSEFKPELAGVFFRVSPKYLYLVATDTFRLAEKIINLEDSGKESNFSFILPGRVAQELARILGEGEEIKISLGENQAQLESGGTKIISRLIEGSFPEYAGIIPKDFDTTTYLNRQELIGAIRSSSIFASKIQETALSFCGKTLEVRSHNPEIGEHQTNLSCSSSGKEIKVSFNYRYLLDGLNSLEEEEIFMGCNLENAPTLVRNKEDGSFAYVLMPIRLT